MDVFYALAEPHRRKVVEILAHKGQLNATQISDEFDVTPQAISQHLKVLREAGVIRMMRNAQQRIYAFNPMSMREVEKWAADMAEMWDSRLARLDKALKEGAGSAGGRRAP